MFQRFFGEGPNNDYQENFIIHLVVAIIVEELLKTTLEKCEFVFETGRVAFDWSSILFSKVQLVQMQQECHDVP